MLPTPDLGGPSSISQDDGASTEVTGTLASAMAWMTAGNGSRTSPEKLKPTPNSVAIPGRRQRRAGKTRTEDGIDNMIGRLQCGREIIDKGDVEIFQLLGEALRTRMSVLPERQESISGAGRRTDGSTMHMKAGPGASPQVGWSRSSAIEIITRDHLRPWRSGPGNARLRRGWKKKCPHYLVKIILTPFGVVDGWLVTVVAEMAGSDQPIAP